MPTAAHQRAGSPGSGTTVVDPSLTVDGLVQLIHRVASLRRVYATLPSAVSAAGGEATDVAVSTEFLLEVLLSCPHIDRTSADAVVAFVASPRALQGGMHIPVPCGPTAVVVPHPLVDLDIDAHIQKCSSTMNAISLDDLSSDDCACAAFPPSTAWQHVPALCRTLGGVVDYQSNVMVPFRGFLQQTLQPTLELVVGSWRTEASSRPTYNTDVAKALRDATAALQNWWTMRIQRLGASRGALDNAAASIARMLNDLAVAVDPIQQDACGASVSRNPTLSLSDAFCADVLRVCSEAEDELGAWMAALQSHTTAARGQGPSDDGGCRLSNPQVVAALLRATQSAGGDALSSASGMCSTLSSLGALLLERSIVESEFTSATYAMVQDYVADMATHHAALLEAYRALCRQQAAQRNAILDANAVQWATLMEAFCVQKQSTNSRLPSLRDGPPQRGRPAWWEDAASDEESEATSSAANMTHRPLAPTSSSCRPSSLCSELSAALSAMCRQRLGALMPAAGDPMRQQAILEALFDAWKAKAVRTAVVYIAHAHTRPDALATANVDMKELLCALLDVWSLSAQRIALDADDDDANTMLRAGEQAMRDVALVVHLLLHRCSAALAPVPADGGSAPAVVVTCEVPPDDDDVGACSTDAFWQDVYEVLWFQVDPLGTASGGYMFPLSPRGDGISPLAQHSFGFLTLRSVVLVVSSPLQLQLVYHTSMFAADRQRRATTCIRGRTLEQHMRDVRRSGAATAEAHAAIAARVALMRRVVYCFAKLEKHKLLLQPSKHHHSGFACDVDAVSTTPLTEMVVVWHYADADVGGERVMVDDPPVSPAQGIACIGIVPPQALALKRRCTGLLPLPLSTQLDDLQQSVVAQLAFVVQRLSLFAQPVIPLLADAAEALLESIIVGAPPATELQGCLSVAAFLCFFDDIAASIGTRAVTPVATPSASTPLRGDVLVGARSFSVQTVADDESSVIGNGSYQGNRIDSFNFSRQTPTPRGHQQHTSGDYAPHEGAELLSLRASKKRWNNDDASPGVFAIPELSSKTCADDKHIVVRPAHPPCSTMELAFEAQLEDAELGRHRDDCASSSALEPLPTSSELLLLPSNVGAMFHAVVEHASAKTPTCRKSSPLIRSPAQRRGTSPMRHGPSVEAFVFSAPLEIVVYAASRQVVSPRLRDLVTTTAKRLKLRALDLPSPHDLLQTTLDTDEEAAAFLGCPVPCRPQPTRPSGKENSGRDVPIAAKKQQWLMLTRSDGNKEWGFLALRLR